MAKKIKLTPYDPDKYRDELNQSVWEESGFKTGKEYSDWFDERLRKFEEDVKASGLSILDYVMALKIKQAQENG
jgi:hypothetical protein